MHGKTVEHMDTVLCRLEKASLKLIYTTYIAILKS